MQHFLCLCASGVMATVPVAKRGRKTTRNRAATPQTTETATTRETSRRRRRPTPRFDTEGTPAASIDATDPLQSRGVILPSVAGPQSCPRRARHRSATAGDKSAADGGRPRRIRATVGNTSCQPKNCFTYRCNPLNEHRCSS